jgi:hypothetical protein
MMSVRKQIARQSTNYRVIGNHHFTFDSFNSELGFNPSSAVAACKRFVEKNQVEKRTYYTVRKIDGRYIITE